MKVIKTLEYRREKNGDRVQWALFLCSLCGARVERRLHLGQIQKSCGCIRYKHRSCYTKLYQVWAAMLYRCSHPGRYFGVPVNPKWKSFTVFQKWALAHGYVEGLYIDRKNNEKGYTPSNCRWVTPQESGVNRRTTRLDWVKVAEIRKLAANGIPQKEIALQYGIRHGHCSRIISLHRWKPTKDLSLTGEVRQQHFAPAKD